MINFKTIIVCSAFLLNICLLATENSHQSPLVFSEMTVDIPPGDDGSWIELYNRSDKAVKADGYTIFCNDKEVFSFPAKNLVVQPKGLVVIRFDKNIKNSEIDPFDLRVIKAKTFPEKVKIDPKKIKRKGKIGKIHPIIKQRSPGYCALFKNKEAIKENFIDYVVWGRPKYVKMFLGEEISKEYSDWANQKEIWNGYGGIPVGIDPLVGDSFYPEKSAIQRKLFLDQSKQRDCWTTEPLNETTPGKGNLWPTLSLPSFGAELYLGDKLKISVFDYGYDDRLFYIVKRDKIKVRLQIARDPHFEEIIYNKLIPPKTIINDYDFKAGTYFARVRIDMDEVTTDWSPVTSFKYRNKRKE